MLEIKEKLIALRYSLEGELKKLEASQSVFVRDLPNQNNKYRVHMLYTIRVNNYLQEFIVWMPQSGDELFWEGAN